MTYTVRQLIINAYYTSGVVAQDQQTVTGNQISQGLSLLNDLLAVKTARNRLIPYYTLYQTTAVIGQESYFIPNLILAETVTFNLQDIRFSTMRQARKVYFGSARVDNISALPFAAHFERSKGGSTLYLYFLPADTYPIKIWGKFSLASVTLDQDLSLTLDRYYLTYLRYALGEYICADNNITLQPQNQAKLVELESIITDVSPMDLATTKLSSLQRQSGINWAFVNVSGGWVPS